MKYLHIIFGLIISVNSYAQKLKSNDIYKARAETMFQKVWDHYRLKQYPGLFAENYPSGNKVDLNYFQGSGVKEKEVSFLWPFSGMFSAANVLIKFPDLKKKYENYLDTLKNGVWSYRDTTRTPIGYQAYPAALEKSDRYYDDNALVCIDYLESYLNTNDPAYITKAKEVFNFIISGWDEKLDGGVYWVEGHKDQKPACTNGMATLAALKLYQCSKDSLYLDWGKRFYNWMYARLRNPQGIYYNDVKMDGKPNEVYYTYNSGSMLEASVLLYHFTNDVKYIKEAEIIASSTFSFFSSIDKQGKRVFKIDLPWFVTVLFRGYEALYKVNQDPRFINAIVSHLDDAWEKSSDSLGFLSAKWATDKEAKAKPKWLLDQACIAELYGRISLLKIRH